MLVWGLLKLGALVLSGLAGHATGRLATAGRVYLDEQILRTLHQGGGELAAPELVRQAGISATTCQRHCEAMGKRGLLLFVRMTEPVCCDHHGEVKLQGGLRLRLTELGQQMGAALCGMDEYQVAQAAAAASNSPGALPS